MLNWLKGLIRKPPAIAVAGPDAPLSQEQLSPPARDWEMLLSSWLGHDREAGLRAIRSSQSSVRLAAILKRLNDWVPQVRAAALEALEDYLNPQHAHLLSAQMPAILVLASKKRADHSLTISRLEAALAMKECAAHCAAAFWTSRGAIARFFFNTLIQTKTEDELAAFLVEVMRHPDLAARQVALAKAQDLPEAAAQAVHALGLSSASGVLRAQAFLAVVRLEGDHARLIEHSLIDPSCAVKSTAIWAAGKYGVDASKVLQRRLAGDLPATKAQWRGVLGLAQRLNRRMPEHWVQPAMAQGSGVVRALTLSIEGSHRPQMLMPALEDRSQRVFDVAIRGVNQLAWTDIRGGLMSMLERNWETLEPLRRRALLNVMPKWTQAQWMLRRLETQTDTGYWLDQLKHWAAQQYMVFDRLTTQDEREQVIQQLTELEAAGRLPAGTMAQLI